MPRPAGRLLCSGPVVHDMPTLDTETEMTPSISIPGMCNICENTLPGNQLRRHLTRCIEGRHSIRTARDTSESVRSPSLETVQISVRARESPHWMELGVRADTTLHELDRFLRAVWLECGGHLSHFNIGGVVYSMMVPMPGERFLFEPMDEHEAQWLHMGSTVSAAVQPSSGFEHEYDYGTPTELTLEHVEAFGGLAQALSPLQPWHGGKIVVLARNLSLQSCHRCGRPAHWKVMPEDDEDEDFDDELSEWEGAPDVDGPGPITFCGECVPEDADFVALPNSPREGVDCYDNVYSWRTWPLDDDR